MVPPVGGCNIATGTAGPGLCSVSDESWLRTGRRRRRWRTRPSWMHGTWVRDLRGVSWGLHAPQNAARPNQRVPQKSELQYSIQYEPGPPRRPLAWALDPASARRGRVGGVPGSDERASVSVRRGQIGGRSERRPMASGEGSQAWRDKRLAYLIHPSSRRGGDGVTGGGWGAHGGGVTRGHRPP